MIDRDHPLYGVTTVTEAWRKSVEAANEESAPEYRPPADLLPILRVMYYNGFQAALLVQRNIISTSRTRAEAQAKYAALIAELDADSVILKARLNREPN